jgi:hypothetical protein
MKQETVTDQKGREWTVRTFTSFEEADAVQRADDWALTPAERHALVGELIQGEYGPEALRRSNRLHPFVKRTRD